MFAQSLFIKALVHIFIVELCKTNNALPSLDDKDCCAAF